MTIETGTDFVYVEEDKSVVLQPSSSSIPDEDKSGMFLKDT